MPHFMFQNAFIFIFYRQSHTLCKTETCNLTALILERSKDSMNIQPKHVEVNLNLPTKTVSKYFKCIKFRSFKGR